MARLRKKLGLAARQFSQILGVRLRTVQWWEAGECDPQSNQQVVVALVTSYVHRYGVKTFRQRFVKEPARYGKPGRFPVNDSGTRRFQGGNPRGLSTEPTDPRTQNV